MRQPISHCKPLRGRRRGGLRFAWLVVLLPLWLGCSHDDRPELGLVRGRVTLDGKPLAGEVVSFRPVEGGRQSSRKTDEQGHYELIYLRDIRGAKVGKHRVTIGASDLVAKRVPDRYNLKTTLTAEVHPGDNQCDFDLRSD
ncbi:MAG: carboxypeptidase regulatory-like domain-containing protein [Pirellulales bacterium]|nr:carboxypeptidase regulatory-like domain-containing protein [Pirellulales bacterium]